MGRYSYENHGKKIRDTCKKRKEQRINEFHRNNHNDVINDLSAGLTALDIRKKYGYYDIYGYLKRYDLMVIASENAKNKLARVARKNGKKAADVLGGIELKPLTDEIIQFFLDMKNSGKYRSEILNELDVRFGYKRNKYNQLCALYGSPPKNPQTGELNPMYGKSPGKNSGNGIKCYINTNGVSVFCRSSLELKIFAYLMRNGIQFESCKHRIPYEYNGKSRTYLPDFVVGTTIYEIKPKYVVNSKINQTKFSAANDYCIQYGLQFEIITEKTFDLDFFDIQTLDSLIETKIVKMNNTEYNRIINYI